MGAPNGSAKSSSKPCKITRPFWGVWWLCHDSDKGFVPRLLREHLVCSQENGSVGGGWPCSSQARTTQKPLKRDTRICSHGWFPPCKSPTTSYQMTSLDAALAQLCTVWILGHWEEMTPKWAAFPAESWGGGTDQGCRSAEGWRPTQQELKFPGGLDYDSTKGMRISYQVWSTRHRGF